MKRLFRLWIRGKRWIFTLRFKQTDSMEHFPSLISSLARFAHDIKMSSLTTHASEKKNGSRFYCRASWKYLNFEEVRFETILSRSKTEEGAFSINRRSECMRRKNVWGEAEFWPCPHGLQYSPLFNGIKTQYRLIKLVYKNRPQWTSSWVVLEGGSFTLELREVKTTYLILELWTIYCQVPSVVSFMTVLIVKM